MKIRFVGISKIDQNQSCGRALLFCLYRGGKNKFSVGAVDRQSALLTLGDRKNETSVACQ